MKKWLPKTLRWFGSLKMAVLCLSALSLVLCVGTFLESYYSQGYAYNLVYGSLWFHFLLVFLGLNILAAALLRLPFQKRLSGFYLSHLGLLLILVGSLFTLLKGIDGTLTLAPGRTNPSVQLNQPYLYAEIPGKKLFRIAVPKGVFGKNFRQPVGESDSGKPAFTLRRYLPYATEKTFFEPFEGIQASGLTYLLVAPQQSIDGVLSSPPSDYPESIDLGPVSLFHLGQLPNDCVFPQSLPKKNWLLISQEKCHELDTPKDPKDGIALAPEKEFNILTSFGSQMAFRLNSATLSELLVPRVSAWPLDRGLKPQFSAKNRLYDLRELFNGKKVITYIQDRKVFAALLNPPEPTQIVPLPILGPEGAHLALPWMGLKLIVKAFHANAIPIRHYVTKRPEPGEDSPMSAIAIETQSGVYWVTSSAQGKTIPLGDQQILRVRLGKRLLTLPWNFELERFNMDHHPGTRNPASYESFVKVHDPQSDTPEKAHIFMNNPLKKGKYTFYQASYFSLGNTFGSVLQVNYDPGRPLKYIGSVILVIGTALHFYIRRKRNEKMVH